MVNVCAPSKVCSRFSLLQGRKQWLVPTPTVIIDQDADPDATVVEITFGDRLGNHDGLLAKAKFHVNYKGKALRKPLQQVIENSLRYYLRRPTTEDSSF
ncbi:hypothetical protein Leryth_005759 [Lithospermum erythrorhizon]|nr:hypothetical protein Leryth_005759 [Lithospermum erythrorhizon]